MGCTSVGTGEDAREVRGEGVGDGVRGAIGEGLLFCCFCCFC